MEALKNNLLKRLMKKIKEFIEHFISNVVESKNTKGVYYGTKSNR